MNNKHVILYGQGDVDSIINPLIPFNCIYDLDTGIVRYMYENGYTANSELLDPGFFQIFTLNDNRRVVREFYTRKEENPLNLFVRDKSITDQLYNEFMETHYEEIVRCSFRTGLYEVISNFRSERSINPYILYSYECEYYMLNRDPNLEGINLIDVQEYKRFKDKITAYYFKSVDDMYIDLLSKDLYTKSIYILDYAYNFSDNGDIIRNDYITNLTNHRNTINIINAFDKNRLGMEG